MLLITGAGASTTLGPPGEPLPLMSDWASALCTALDENEAGLASACGLKDGMDGEAFEEAIGALLEWQQVRPLEARFAALGGLPVGSEAGPVAAARQNMGDRLDRIMLVINNTLFDQFGQKRVDDQRARMAYEALLKLFDTGELIVATTNYDRSGEAALRQLGRNPDTGFPDTGDRTPTLDVRGLVERGSDRMTPYLHLHGSVGWYESEGVIYDHRGDRPFNPTLGGPVVLYPDPKKDPTKGARVSELWTELEVALAKADHVLVVGHSLHDPALVNAIKNANPRRLGVTYRQQGKGKPPLPAGKMPAERIQKLLPEAHPVRMEFGPELTFNTKDVERLKS
jgi:hypothetical protein